MKILVFILGTFISFNCVAQAPSWFWAKSAGGTGSDITHSVAVDTSGNTYVAGAFRSAILTFNSTTLTNASTGSDDIFIAKYGTNGNLLWAKRAGGTSYDVAYTGTVDASGNSYIAGWFQSNTITFGSTTLTCAGYLDVFLTKYDPNGNVLWAKRAGGVSGDFVTSVTVDSYGNVYMTGVFSSATITFGSTTLTNVGSDDIFIVKYAPNGNVIWAKSEGDVFADYGYAIAVDSIGNTYVAGDFASQSIIFGSDTLVNASSLGQYDLFLAKYDAGGNILWAKSAGESSHDEINSIAADKYGNIYVAGYFSSSPLMIGSTTLTNAGFFLAKFDTNGNTLWAKDGTGSGQEKCVTLDVLGNIYLVGSFTSPTIVFGSDTLTNLGGGDIFLTKYAPNGNVIWAKSEGGTNSDGASSIALDASCNIYLTGWFNSASISFGSDTLVNTGNNSQEIFLASSDSSTATRIKGTSYLLNVTVYPNPAANSIIIESSQQAIIEIFSIQGLQIKTLKASNNKTTIDISTLTSGVYLIKVKNENGVTVRKFVKKDF